MLLSIPVVFAAVVAGQNWLLPPLGRWLDVGDAPQLVDYVMVLPGDANVRPFVAAALVRTGFAEAALVPRTQRNPHVDDGTYPPNEEVVRRVLMHRGVAEDKIQILQGESFSTRSDAHALARFLTSSLNARVCVVTNHYHTRRARATFTSVLEGQASRVTFLSAPTDGFCAEDWWRSEEGFVLVVGEYAKLAYFAVRHTWFGPVAVGGLCLLGVVVFSRRRLRHRPSEVTCPTTPAQNGLPVQYSG